MKEQAYCIYCKKAIPQANKHYIIHLKHESLKEVQCCSEECFKKTQAFMDKDDHSRMKLFIILAVCVVVDLVLVGISNNSNMIYIPLGFMGLALFLWPYIIIRYRSYQRYGIEKTVSNLRKAGLIIMIMSIIFFISI